MNIQNLKAHIQTLSLTHAFLSSPGRAASWLLGTSAAGEYPPLCIVYDLGAILIQPRNLFRLARPRHLPEDTDTSAYLDFLSRMASHPMLREVSSWDMADNGDVVNTLHRGARSG